MTQLEDQLLEHGRWIVRLDGVNIYRLVPPIYRAMTVVYCDRAGGTLVIKSGRGSLSGSILERNPRNLHF